MKLTFRMVYEWKDLEILAQGWLISRWLKKKMGKKVESIYMRKFSKGWWKFRVHLEKYERRQRILFDWSARWYKDEDGYFKGYKNERMVWMVLWWHIASKMYIAANLIIKKRRYKINKQINVKLTDFDRMSTRQGLFYAKRQKNRFHCTFMLRFSFSCFLKDFLRHRVLSNTDTFSTDLLDP